LLQLHTNIILTKINKVELIKKWPTKWPTVKINSYENTY